MRVRLRFTIRDSVRLKVWFRVRIRVMFMFGVGLGLSFGFG